jgi:hypothetical protein
MLQWVARRRRREGERKDKKGRRRGDLSLLLRSLSFELKIL